MNPPFCSRPFVEPLETRIAPAFGAVLELSGLTGLDGFQISGESAEDYSGFSVSGAGDINGDGFGDLLIGAPNALGNNFSGASYVVFGRAAAFSANLDLATLDGGSGFQIKGEQPDDASGRAVSGAGDINGDGFDDLLIGAPDAGPNGAFSGAGYVVFGHAGAFTPTLELSSLTGVNGFRINGENAGDRFGSGVNRAGDINGDGFDDLLIGAIGADPHGESSGATYVVLGHAGPFNATLELSGLTGANGFQINGEDAYDNTGRVVSTAGDINGDGFDDMLIGGGIGGTSYVVLGHGDLFAATLELSTLTGTNGFEIHGEVVGDSAGRAVSAAGDVNGDGFADMLIGAYTAEPNGGVSGATYVVFGKEGAFAAALELSALNGTNGFQINGEASTDQSARAVSAAGDVNGDDFADILIGAPLASPNGRSGASYVVFGHGGAFAATLELSSLTGANGFQINGEAQFDYAGDAVSAAGDINGDGIGDLLIGAQGADPNGSNSGASYVVFGQGSDAAVPVVTISGDAKKATFIDVDGDKVTVKTTTGQFTQTMFDLRAEGPGAQLEKLTLSDASFARANLSFKAKPVGGLGNEQVNVGAVDATGVALGKLKVAGDLGQLDASSAKQLTAKSLGFVEGTQEPGTVDRFHSVVGSPSGGNIGKLNIAGTLRGIVEVAGNLGTATVGLDLGIGGSGGAIGLIRAGGDIGLVSIGGSVFARADQTEPSGIRAGGTLGSVVISFDFGGLRLGGKSAVISALGQLNPTSADATVAIGTVSIGRDIANAAILAGYDANLIAMNADASIGPIKVGRDWTATDVAAGVADVTSDGFGRNDAVIPGGSAGLLAQIASVTIKGVATGSVSPVTDHYGITAEIIGKAKITKIALLLTAGKDNLLIDPLTNDFRLVEV